MTETKTEHQNVNVRMPDKLVARLDAACKAGSYSRSEAVRAALRDWLPGPIVEIDGEQVIQGLAGGTSYTWTARAAYDPKDHVPGKPAITGVSGIDGGIWLQWDEPESETPIKGYEYRAVRPAEDEDWKVVVHGAKNDQAFVGFTPGIEQTIALRAVNAAGPGPSVEATARPRPWNKT